MLSGVVRSNQIERGEHMDYILRDIHIELWSEVKAKATLERKTMQEVIFESLKWLYNAGSSYHQSLQEEKG